MRFAVPQFIDHQAKIIGPMTFGQFFYIGGAGGICFILYFMLPFSFFIAACIIIIGGATAMAFLRINGRNLASVLGSFLKFNLMPKSYIWKRKEIPISRVNVDKENTESDISLSIAGKSQLKKIKTKIEN
jgi:hypothetical protein